jgi:hypothetical protein
MDFVRWLFENFGYFFGPVFLLYIYLMVRRLTLLYELLRHVPGGEGPTMVAVGCNRAMGFLEPLLARLKTVCLRSAGSRENIIDAIWSEVECRVAVHFTALNGYGNTLVLIGFAGTIFGSIGAFEKMFAGLARNEAASQVLTAAWENGLATALYTSLGAAAIGGGMVSLLCSRFLMTRAKWLETMVSLRIGEIIEEGR